eukprot:3453152-Pyramimonas_sp.AAC.1
MNSPFRSHRIHIGLFAFTSADALLIPFRPPHFPPHFSPPDRTLFAFASDCVVPHGSESFSISQGPFCPLDA